MRRAAGAAVSAADAVRRAAVVASAATAVAAVVASRRAVVAREADLAIVVEGEVDAAAVDSAVEGAATRRATCLFLASLWLSLRSPCCISLTPCLATVSHSR